MKNIYKTLVLVLLLSSLLFAACSGEHAEGENKVNSSDSSATDSSKKVSAKLAEAKEEDLDLVPVEIFEVWRGAISSYIILSSTVETEQYVDVYPYLTGIVATLLAEEGDDLRKGAPLLRLDAEEYQLREAKALTGYKSVQSEFKRARAQFDKELLSKEEYDKASLSLEQAKLSWQEAKLNLDRTIVRAPIDGIVSLRNVRQGDRVTPNDHIYSMVNLENIIATV
ncbi:MAG: efflux RND transporter periplasmic adaptor subunit, partial [Candidatus Marinimicrobia bacterium]|nr:efflux RND transporter periplasmic adaptor subunit [Candidatus Neomarinimicrobiota bacterium]